MVGMGERKQRKDVMLFVLQKMETSGSEIEETKKGQILQNLSLPAAGAVLETECYLN